MQGIRGEGQRYQSGERKSDGDDRLANEWIPKGRWSGRFTLAIDFAALAIQIGMLHLRLLLPLLLGFRRG